MTSPLHRSSPHEAAARHVTGEARYVDDLPEPPGLLHGWLVTSPHAHARITSRDAAPARAVPGVVDVLFAADVPGHNHIGPIVHDEPLLAEDEVMSTGQVVALVLATSIAAAREGAAAVHVTYEPLPAILTIDDAVAAGSFLTKAHVIARGDVDAALAAAPVRIEGTSSNGGQDHFYLETHAALCIPEEHGNFLVYSSTQHPTEVQKETALVLGVPSAKVVCECPRMGGGFGGKESQATNFGALAALGAWRTGRPVKVRLERDTDMRSTGKRHPFQATYRAGFTEDGRLLALDARLYSDGGFVTDLSGAIMDRALFHLDNAYFVPALRFEGRACRTNLPSNTAFRGFGGPQGMLVVEHAIARFAERQGLDPAEVRRRNYYDGDRNQAPYGQRITDPRAHRIHDALLASSDYAGRRAAIEAFNATSPFIKRGIGLQPVKFGISFTNSILNQAGALVLMYADGSVQLNHGGTEMGQGLYTKMLAVCAHELGVPVEHIRHMQTRTDKVPNTSATAASSGTDLNGQAVVDACRQIRERMRPVAAELLGVDPADVRFEAGEARGGGRSAPIAQVATTCWVRQVSLAASGFYRTPGIAYDHARGQGTPFYYYAWGAAVVEVEVNGLTGEHRQRRVDILHDVGDALIPSIDRGQVEGAYVQGAGWLTMEEVLYDRTGRLLTHGPSTYKIPAVGDAPDDFRVALLERATQDGVVGGSKAVGEPPFMLAIGLMTALRHAIGGFAAAGAEIELAIPATPESILRAVEHARAHAKSQTVAAK